MNIAEALNDAARTVHGASPLAGGHDRYVGPGIHGEAKYELIPFDECPADPCPQYRQAIADHKALIAELQELVPRLARYDSPDDWDRFDRLTGSAS